MQKAWGVLFGAVVHGLFAFTVWHLVWFLEGGDPRGSDSGRVTAAAILIDVALALLFAVPHSVFLLPSVRRRIVTAGLGAPLYGCFYCAITCLALLTTIFCWRPMGMVLWQWPRPLDTVVTWCFVGAWVALIASISLTGLGWQTGLTPWWHWVRGRPTPKREFTERGAYRVLRHPVYLSFLGLVWFVPVVTLDRGVLIAIWTGYIFVGSVLKDRRLLFFVGEAYREYQARVPGYPGMPFGPLARVPRSPAAVVLGGHGAVVRDSLGGPLTPARAS